MYPTTSSTQTSWHPLAHTLELPLPSLQEATRAHPESFDAVLSEQTLSEEGCAVFLGPYSLLPVPIEGISADGGGLGCRPTVLPMLTSGTQSFN